MDLYHLEADVLDDFTSSLTHIRVKVFTKTARRFLSPTTTHTHKGMCVGKREGWRGGEGGKWEGGLGVWGCLDGL